jgi:serralysin
LIWNTDSNGNFISSANATSTSVESYETSFHQDLNGDGIIGVPVSTTAVIESLGSTSLTEIANSFYLDSNSSGTGPALTYGGTVIVASNMASWTAIGAEQTASGYEVAWKNAGGYLIWNTDSNGNFISSANATSTSVESYETSFHQDLNGDGVIGVPGVQGTAVAATAPPSNPQPSTGQEQISGTTITATAPNQTLTGTGSNDNFVFAVAPGHATITNFQPVNDVIQIDHSAFANVQALLSASQDDGHGNVVITADANDTITLQHVTLAQLLAHQGDFHIT